MADWSLPTIATTYVLFLQYLLDRDVDAFTLGLSLPSNPPIGAIRYVRASNKFQEYDGAVWNDKLLSIAGGGTGAATAGAARTALGLGDMATQTSGAVSITGGTISGNGAGLTSLNASNLATGTVGTARLGSGAASSSSYLRGDQTWAALSVFLPYAASQSADFTAAVETLYPLTGTHVATLPTVVGNGGKRIGLVNLGTGSWGITPNGTETINGVTGASAFSFNFGQYSSMFLYANANNSGWDVF